MAAIPNIIKIGSTTEPDFTFDNDAIDLDSIDIEENVDLIESELAIDVFNVVVKYVQGNGADLRAVPYGTPVFHYVNGSLVRKYYIKKIDRVGRTKFKISTFSAIGILSRQYHKGGVYTGITFADLIDDLIDDAVPYSCDLDVGATKIFGWLPYATKRENLHQIMFAENISIVKDANCDIRFTFLRLPQTPAEIPQNRIFIGGAIEYPAVASLVQLTEHSYQPVDLLERVTLIDNSDKTPANNKLFVFDTAPIIVSSLIASSGLTVVEAGVNYAIVTGQGTLTGIPYYDKTSIVQKSYNSGGEAYSVSVERGTLVTGVNSENVIDRLLSFYTSNEKVTADVKVMNEKCGEVYSFTDMYGDTIIAYLAKMTSKISSLIRSSCKFITGYQPETFGNNYTHWAAVEHNGWIIIPEGTTIVRFVIISGGDGGSSGLKGVDDYENLQAGSKGGEPGSPGKGGLIREIVIHNPTAGQYECLVGAGGEGGAICESETSRNLGTAGEHSQVTTPGGTVYSTQDSAAYRSVNGIKNLFTDEVYAKQGKAGVKGGDGGRGSISGNGEPGEDVEYEGATYKGGKGGSGFQFEFKNIDQTLVNGGAGGSGAQAFLDGLDGGDASIALYEDITTQKSGYKAYEYGKFLRATPASNFGPARYKQPQSQGDGGNAGHGGAGRGGFGSANDYYMSTSDPTDNKKIYLEMYEDEGWVYENFKSSNGGAGKNGKGGIVVCYADQPLETIVLVRDTPDNFEYDGYSLVGEQGQMSFSWDNSGASKYQLQISVSYSGGYSWSEWGDWNVNIESNAARLTGTFQANLGTLYRARVIAIGEGMYADSEPTEELMVVQLSAYNSYDPPDLQAAPVYKNGEFRIGLFAGSADGTYADKVAATGTKRWNTVFEQDESEEWNYSRFLYLPAYIEAEEGQTYNFKSAYIESSNNPYLISDFSDPTSATVPTQEDVETKLLPPVAISASYIRNGMTSGALTFDSLFFYAGDTDDRANIAELWAMTNGQPTTKWANINLASVHAGANVAYGTEFRYGSFSRSRYTYALRNVDSNGVYTQSEFSDPMFVIDIPANKLETPTITARTLVSNRLTLSWDEVEHAASYKIIRYNKANSTYILVSTIAAGVGTTTVTVSDDDVYNNYHYWFLQAIAETGYIDSQPADAGVQVSGDEPNEQILFDSTTNLLGTFLYGAGPTVVTVANNTLTVQGQQSGLYYPAYSANKIDLTNATQLKFTGTFEKLGYNLEFGFCDSRPEAMGGAYKTGDQNVVVYGVLNSNQTFNDNVVLDVTNYTGEHYFYFKTYGDDLSSTNVVNRLTLTKISLAQA